MFQSAPPQVAKDIAQAAYDHIDETARCVCKAGLLEDAITTLTLCTWSRLQCARCIFSSADDSQRGSVQLARRAREGGCTSRGLSPGAGPELQIATLYNPGVHHIGTWTLQVFGDWFLAALLIQVFGVRLAEPHKKPS